MLSSDQLHETVRRIVGTASQPVRVILFGSHARGGADAGSDLDLMVVERDLQDRGSEYLKLKKAVGRLGVGVDLLVCSEQDFERRSQVPGTVHYWARKEGKVLHEPAA